MTDFTVYTDGSCLNNPGPGGWAAIIIDNVSGEREEISGGITRTTNNRMEVMAAVCALRKIPAGTSVNLYTDSAYLRKSVTEGWLDNWKVNGWFNTNKKSISNKDLWVELDNLISERSVTFRWVKAHSGNPHNEWCDQLAKAAAVNSVVQSGIIKNPNETLSLTDSLFGESMRLPSSKIKIAKKLQMKKYRAEMNLFVAEGLRLCEMALNSEKIEFGFYTEDFLKSERAKKLVEELEKVTEIHKIPSDSFDKISETQTPQGILLVLKQNLSTAEAVTKKNLIVVLDNVKDPGNVGTILRTAEAFDCGVILLEGAADVFNSKVVRSSMGAIFTLPITILSRKEFLNLMKSLNFEVTATILDNESEVYSDHDFTKKSAIVFGSEAEGVSKEIADAAEKIFIPMCGKAESLNVATAVAVVISEAMRQRGLHFN